MKKRVVILFGGRSGEHEVSIVSATAIFKALDKSQYDVTLVGIDKEGRWLLPDESKLLAQSSNPKLVSLNQTKEQVGLLPFEGNRKLISLSGIGNKETQNQIDVIIPVLHGPNGEDGTMQGLLELANIPFVGSGVLGSALCMDKDAAKRIMRDAGIPVVPFMTAKRTEFKKNAEAMISEMEKQFGYPFFVKPANLGSSVGVEKVKSKSEARQKIEKSFQYDTKVLIEKAVNARELECAVLGNDEPKASIVGEIVPRAEFYSYEAKYVDENGADLKIPAQDLDPMLSDKIQQYSLKAFQALECAGLARIDFFLDRDTKEIYLNEVNTFPGFTPVSMYPKLWEASGLSYPKLLDRLIELALERFAEKAKNETSFG